MRPPCCVVVVLAIVGQGAHGSHLPQAVVVVGVGMRLGKVVVHMGAPLRQHKPAVGVEVGQCLEVLVVLRSGLLLCIRCAWTAQSLRMAVLDPVTRIVAAPGRGVEEELVVRFGCPSLGHCCPQKGR